MNHSLRNYNGGLKLPLAGGPFGEQGATMPPLNNLSTEQAFSNRFNCATFQWLGSYFLTVMLHVNRTDFGCKMQLVHVLCTKVHKTGAAGIEAHNSVTV